MKDPDSDIVDVESLSVLSISPSYVMLLKEVRKLSSIDLDLLTSDKHKICFFTNVLNVLLSHAVISKVTSCFSTKGSGARDQNTEDRHSVSKLWEKCLPRLDYSYCRTLYLKKYGYHIGKLGFVKYVQ